MFDEEVSEIRLSGGGGEKGTKAEWQDEESFHFRKYEVRRRVAEGVFPVIHFGLRMEA